MLTTYRDKVYRLLVLQLYFRPGRTRRSMPTEAPGRARDAQDALVSPKPMDGREATMHRRAPRGRELPSALTSLRIYNCSIEASRDCFIHHGRFLVPLPGAAGEACLYFWQDLYLLDP